MYSYERETSYEWRRDKKMPPGITFLHHCWRISYPLAARHYESQYWHNIEPLRAKSATKESMESK